MSISSPTNGQTVTGIISITGTASDPDGDDQIEKVQVRIDSGSWIDATGTASWSYSWNTNGVSDSGHTIYARSYDGIDYSSVYSVSVIVDNEEEPTPPPPGGGGSPPPGPPPTPEDPIPYVEPIYHNYGRLDISVGVIDQSLAINVENHGGGTFTFDMRPSRIWISVIPQSGGPVGSGPWSCEVSIDTSTLDSGEHYKEYIFVDWNYGTESGTKKVTIEFDTDGEDSYEEIVDIAVLD